ncbi:unnamed protein product [Vitrella brassicaformis CCMP3155]|uniref:Ammonium transporter AmtB-like domain-containing protein n=3 Tax=Vitrella brassicaformis TaxID=1169539 RepID=A0A0G4H0T5_VITBC|nr:unnamed protein product [Vitrella brassicaformis CCMP3155]|eukprot:CEM37185.1 unnamed protein product [Vitrella brassicaformis CCMP3155]
MRAKPIRCILLQAPVDCKVVAYVDLSTGPGAAGAAAMSASIGRSYRFTLAFLIIQGALIALYAVGSTTTLKTKPDTHLTDDYALYQDVHVMIFIGFGFLMAFLRRYGFSAVGFNYMIAALAIEWAMLVVGYSKQLIPSASDEASFPTKVVISVQQLVQGDFAAAAVLISFGALLGKTGPLQLMFLTLFECVAYAVNLRLLDLLGVSDVGGSLGIHAFGCYFGLAASAILSPREVLAEQPDNASSYFSDLFAMIGSVFLWIFWPSFVAIPVHGAAREMCILHTVLAIASSCLTAMAVSMSIRPEKEMKKLSMVDVQNATLAGGVAVGIVANFPIHPWGAMVVGSLAGILSVVGIAFISPAMERYLGLHDTCGVHNLHGMPALLGAVISVIVASLTSDTPSAVTQLLGIVVMLGVAITAGLITGLLVLKADAVPPSKLFLDDMHWETPEPALPEGFVEAPGTGGMAKSVVVPIGTDDKNEPLLAS